MRRIMPLLVLVALLLAAATAYAQAEEEAAAEPKAWYDNIRVNGYFQTRFEARSYPDGYSDFDEFTVRRLYINVIAPFDNKTTAVVTWAGVGPEFREGANSDWANIFVDHRVAPEWNIRIGQAPTHFGIDTCESATCLFTPERWAAGEGKPGLGLHGLYFAGPWDRGLWVMYDTRPRPNVMVPSADNTGVRVVGSVHNGQFRDTDKDSDKNVSLDVTYFDEWGQAGVSWLDGTYTTGGGVTDDRDAWNLNFRVYPGAFVRNVGFQGEWLDGKWLGTDRRGWYGQASYHLPDRPSIAYTRYQQFDPDTSVSDNKYKALQLGYKHEVTPLDEITVEYSLGDLGGDNANDLVVQYQRKF